MRDIQAEVSRAPAADVPWNGVVPPSHRTIRGCQRRAFRRRHAHPTRSGVVDASYAMVPMGPWAHHRALCQNQGDGIRSGVERAARPCEDLPWLGRSAAQLHGTSMLRRRRDHTEPRRGGGGGFAYACRGWRSIFVQDQHEKRPNAAAVPCRVCAKSRCTHTTWTGGWHSIWSEKAPRYRSRRAYSCDACSSARTPQRRSTPTETVNLDALKKSATKRSPRRGAEERRGASRRVVGVRSFVSLNVIYFRLLFRS